jgi:hypothetical protein
MKKAALADGPLSHQSSVRYLARGLRFVGVLRFAGVLVRAVRVARVVARFVFFAIDGSSICSLGLPAFTRCVRKITLLDARQSRH